MRCILFGARSEGLRDLITSHGACELVDAEPEAIICYGGDGTLLTAEQRWPGIPKVPIRNSRRGNRCMAHPTIDILDRLVEGTLNRNEYVKIDCAIRPPDAAEPSHRVTAMNEINVHMGRINSAVRFTMRINEEPCQADEEIIGDGFVVSTPFGSWAYFHQITRGVFHTGLGIAYKSTWSHTSHIIVPEDVTIRAGITRGPAVLAYDNAEAFYDLERGHELTIVRSRRPAVVLTWDPMSHPCDHF